MCIGYTIGMKDKNTKTVTQSPWGTRQEILANAMRTLERDIEWPLTELLSLTEVNTLLAPLRARINGMIE